MPRKSKKTEPEYSFLGISVKNFNAVIDASINYEVRDLRERHGDEKIYSFSTQVDIEGLCTYPEDCSQESFTITIYGDDRRDKRFTLTLNDCHAVDDNWKRVYKTVKGQQVPVYDIPKGVGFLERKRGTKAWVGYIWAPPRIVSDMLKLLPTVKPLYLGIHRQKAERGYNIISLSLQTNDPAESY